MFRARLVLLWCASWLLFACSSDPTRPDPIWRIQAYEAEQDGAQRYQRGDYDAASKRFATAERLFQAIDDSLSVQRLRRHQARVWLSTDQAARALAVLELPQGQQADADLRNNSLDNQLLRLQAQLQLKQIAAAASTFAAARESCQNTCPHAASLALLGARLALSEDRASAAVPLIESALQQLQSGTAPRELANAWRLLAEARLALGETQAALVAAHLALDQDRELALPEKISRDWLLIGHIQRQIGAGETALYAFKQALAIAQAAGLTEPARAAAAALLPEQHLGTY